MNASRAASALPDCAYLNSATAVMVAASDVVTWGNPPMTKRIHHLSSRC